MMVSTSLDLDKIVKLLSPSRLYWNVLKLSKEMIPAEQLNQIAQWLSKYVENAGVNVLWALQPVS